MSNWSGASECLSVQMFQAHINAGTGWWSNGQYFISPEADACACKRANEGANERGLGCEQQTTRGKREYQRRVLDWDDDHLQFYDHIFQSFRSDAGL